MKLFLKLGLILLAFCVVATALLAYVNSVTKPKIDANKANEETNARRELIPGAVFERIAVAQPQADSLVYFVARDSLTQAVKGYTFTAAKHGYSSKVKTMAAVDSAFQMIAIKVVDQAETPGLGANCTDSTFTAKFRKLRADQLKVDKDGGPVVSMTGATITTRAITNSLREQILLVKADVESRQKPEEEPKP